MTHLPLYGRCVSFFVPCPCAASFSGVRTGMVCPWEWMSYVPSVFFHIECFYSEVS